MKIQKKIFGGGGMIRVGLGVGVVWVDVNGEAKLL